MIKLYGIPNCNTVKKAQDWLKKNGVDYEWHDFKKSGITAEKLNTWFGTFGWEKVLNKAGLTYKKLSKEEQLTIDADKALTYLQANTSAIKRPVLELDGKAVLLGFKDEDYEQVLVK